MEQPVKDLALSLVWVLLLWHSNFCMPWVQPKKSVSCEITVKDISKEEDIWKKVQI